MPAPAYRVVTIPPNNAKRLTAAAVTKFSKYARRKSQDFPETRDAIVSFPRASDVRRGRARARGTCAPVRERARKRTRFLRPPRDVLSEPRVDAFTALSAVPPASLRKPKNRRGRRLGADDNQEEIHEADDSRARESSLT